MADIVLDGVTHGTSYSYRKGCRCDPCKQENYRSQKAWREKVWARPIPEHVHGTINGYKIYGCRCDPCTTANREANRRERRRKIRLRELAEAGLPRDWS